MWLTKDVEAIADRLIAKNYPHDDTIEARFVRKLFKSFLVQFSYELDLVNSQLQPIEEVLVAISEAFALMAFNGYIAVHASGGDATQAAIIATNVFTGNFITRMNSDFSMDNQVPLASLHEAGRA